MQSISVSLTQLKTDAHNFQESPPESIPLFFNQELVSPKGLGFSVYMTIFLCERFGAPLMQSAAIVIGLAVGCIIAAATGYFDNSGINSAPAVSFIWVQTFKLQVYPPLVLPMMAVVLICMCETIGDITATCDVSRLEVEGRMYESRIQGGVLADGVNSIL